MKFINTILAGAVVSTAAIGIIADPAAAFTLSNGVEVESDDNFAASITKLSNFSFAGQTYTITFGSGNAAEAGATDFGADALGFGSAIASSLNLFTAERPGFAFSVNDGLGSSATQFGVRNSSVGDVNTGNDPRFSGNFGAWSSANTVDENKETNFAWVIAETDTTEVPEPLTILGSLAAVGIGATLRRKQNS